MTERELAEKTIIATSTWYNPDSESDNIRARCAKTSTSVAIDSGYDVVVVDGGSSDSFLRSLQNLGAKVFTRTEKGMGNGKRQAIHVATQQDRPIVAYTDPERETYIPELWKTIIPLMEDRADMTVPNRGNLDSYPLMQQHAENFGNGFWAELTGVPLDVWFGSRTWTKENSLYFLNYDGEYGDKWDAHFIPVMDAVLDGKRVLNVDINYSHPPEQTAIETGDIGFNLKRIEQLRVLTNSLYNHWTKHSRD